MADPFSVAAGTVGVISLGIQVCQGLVRFYSDYRSASSDIKRICSSLDVLSNTLERLQSTLIQLELGSASDIASKALEACSSGITELEEYLKKCRVSQSWKGQRKRLRYPFQKESLRALKSNVEDLRQNLSLALQTLGF